MDAPSYPIKLMATIVNRDKAEQVITICNEFELPYHMILLAHGTATGEILDYFGLTSTDKVLILSLITDAFFPDVRAALRAELQLRRKGHGILFTLPVSCISKMAASVLADITCTCQTNGTEVKKMEITQHDLILAIVNQGFSDQAMAAAKEAGAGGGTLLHARKIGSDHEGEFFGISIKQEKEIVAILTSFERRNEIMKALLSAVGASTPAQGTVLSLPVDSVEGVNFNKE